MTAALKINDADKAPECKPVKRGFGTLPCILCGADCSISLDLDDCDTFRCGECEETFTASDVRNMLQMWGKVLAWVETAPELPQE